MWSPSLATLASGFIFAAINVEIPESQPDDDRLGGGVLERPPFLGATSLALGLAEPLSLPGALSMRLLRGLRGGLFGLGLSAGGAGGGGAAGSLAAP
jgi:hypothetical protein